MTKKNKKKFSLKNTPLGRIFDMVKTDDETTLTSNEPVTRKPKASTAKPKSSEEVLKVSSDKAKNEDYGESNANVFREKFVLEKRDVLDENRRESDAKVFREKFVFEKSGESVSHEESTLEKTDVPIFHDEFNWGKTDALASRDDFASKKPDVLASREGPALKKLDVSAFSEDLTLKKTDVSTSSEDPASKKLDVLASREDFTSKKHDVSTARKDFDFEKSNLWSSQSMFDNDDTVEGMSIFKDTDKTPLQKTSFKDRSWTIGEAKDVDKKGIFREPQKTVVKKKLTIILIENTAELAPEEDKIKSILSKLEKQGDVSIILYGTLVKEITKDEFDFWKTFAHTEKTRFYDALVELEKVFSSKYQKITDEKILYTHVDIIGIGTATDNGSTFSKEMAIESFSKVIEKVDVLSKYFCTTDEYFVNVAEIGFHSIGAFSSEY